MKHGTVIQRHLRSCPRDEDGRYRPHRCHGTWSYVIDLPRGADGRRRQTTKAGFPTKSAARQALQEMSALVASDFSLHSLTVGEYLDSWLEGKNSLKPSTKSHYADAIRLYLRPHLGALLLLELRAQHIDRMYAAIATGARGRPLSAGSVRRVHACLRSALNTAAKRRLIPHNPALYVELPPERPHRPTPWTTEQSRAFLASVREDRLAALYQLLLVTGMRRGEAVGLRWTDVDIDRALLVVAQQITEVRGKPVVGTPKTRKGSRLVPLDAWTLDELTRHRERQVGERTRWGEGWEDSGLVFCREDGTPLRPEFVTKHFLKLSRRAGLPRVRLHDLRHTNASMALEAGIDIKVVSERLGHANTAITSDIYTHVSTAVGRAAAVRLGELLAPPGDASGRPAASSSAADVSAV